jgi:UDP-N-acetylglucosamine 2-epimerase
MVIGNSSSGLIEAPAFKVPTVNIGNRQKGRTTSESVINCDDSKTSITNAINKALSNDFKKKLKNTMNPYGNGGASEKIVEKIINHPLENIIYKKFYDSKK